MRVLIDTNILLDFLIGREPYFRLADKLIKLCVERKVEGYMAAHSIPNMFYILRKDMGISDRKKVLKDLCEIIKVESIDSDKITAALENEDFSDFEDCLQYECAKTLNADYIITRNKVDYKGSEVKCVTTEEFFDIV